MSWRTRVAGWVAGPRPDRTPGSRAAARAVAASLAGRVGRLSVDNPFMVMDGPAILLAPGAPEQDWRTLDLDAKTLDRVSPTRLLELLADMSPDVSRALWDYLRMLNPGRTITAYLPGTEDPSEEGQAVVDAIVDRLDDLYGTLDVVIGRLDLAACLRGAYFAEAVLDGAGRDMVDLATPDPAYVRFRARTDPARGRVWDLGQLQGGQFVALDRPTIRYVPIDPFPGSPYGRPLFSPALFTSLFLLGLLHDLRRVVQQQGYPRLDVEVVMEKLRVAMPEDMADDPEASKEWVNAALSEVQKIYASLEPDDTYFHTDAIKVNRPVGAVNAESLGAVEPLVRALERFLVRALKTMPLLMGTTDGVSEANANRQWEIFAAGIKALQHLKENLLGRLFTLALEARGVQATVEVRFAELRAAEMMRDEQTRALRNANAFFEFAVGWTSHEEAAQSTVEHAPDDADGPRQWPKGFGASGDGAAPDTETNPEPGSDRTGLVDARAADDAFDELVLRYAGLIRDALPPPAQPAPALRAPDVDPAATRALADGLTALQRAVRAMADASSRSTPPARATVRKVLERDPATGQLLAVVETSDVSAERTWTVRKVLERDPVTGQLLAVVETHERTEE